MICLFGCDDGRIGDRDGSRHCFHDNTGVVSVSEQDVDSILTVVRSEVIDADGLTLVTCSDFVVFLIHDTIVPLLPLGRTRSLILLLVIRIVDNDVFR